MSSWILHNGKLIPKQEYDIMTGKVLPIFAHPVGTGGPEFVLTVNELKKISHKARQRSGKNLGNADFEVVKDAPLLSKHELLK